MKPTTSEELRGQIAVVTGSSRGIGREIARQFSRAGAHVVLHANTNHAAAEAVAREILSSGHAPAVVEVADLSDPQQTRELVDRCWERMGTIDIWVNNAGADVLTSPAASWDFEAKLAHLWQVDVRATIQLGRAVGARMRDRGGVILNMGWDQAETGMAGDSGEMFSAIKGAISAFTRSLAKSLAPQVRVNCLAPGWIRTEWGEQASPYWQTRAERESLRGRWGTPYDVAQAALFLASAKADFITGHVLPVNGGQTGFPALPATGESSAPP